MNIDINRGEFKFYDVYAVQKDDHYLIRNIMSEEERDEGEVYDHGKIMIIDIDSCTVIPEHAIKSVEVTF